jgi:hypothetical protein
MRRAKNSLTHNIQPGNVCHESALLAHLHKFFLMSRCCSSAFFLHNFRVIYILSIVGKKTISEKSMSYDNFLAFKQVL